MIGCLRVQRVESELGSFGEYRKRISSKFQNRYSVITETGIKKYSRVRIYDPECGGRIQLPTSGAVKSWAFSPLVRYGFANKTIQLLALFLRVVSVRHGHSVTSAAAVAAASLSYNGRRCLNQGAIGAVSTQLKRDTHPFGPLATYFFCPEPLEKFSINFSYGRTASASIS